MQQDSHCLQKTDTMYGKPLILLEKKLITTNKFSKVVEYKINVKKSVVFFSS